MTVPASWMPAAKMSRIHLHWTGGAYAANATDRKSYHVLVDGTPKLVRGDKSIKLNEAPIRGSYSGHTLGANSGAIGISICAMGGADVRESPFVAGKYPITREQWDLAILAIADLAKRYGIPVTPKTILTHAEVQANLGIAQRQKWDITRLVFLPSVVGAKSIGDLMRRSVAAALDGIKAAPAPIPETMKPPRFKVTGVRPSMLNFRDGPNGKAKGALPEGTIVERLNATGDWWQVRTPAGYVGWVWSSYLAAA
jgi:hypothetical protein